jgi:hypothetical protein
MALIAKGSHMGVEAIGGNERLRIRREVVAAAAFRIFQSHKHAKEFGHENSLFALC